MNIKSLKKQSSKIFSAAIVALLIFSIIFLWTGERESSQAAQPMFAGVRFEGEYKIGEGEWRPITAGEHIPADEGDVTLRGIFVMLNPETGEPLGPLSAGSSVNLYFNHIGGTAILPGGGKFMFDSENEDLGEDACAIMWGSVPATGENPITIILHNPHKFGNHYAIDDFFNHMSIVPGIYWEHMELEKGATERTIGILIFITSVVIIGIAVFSTIIHIKHSKVIWMMGLISFFASGYFIFSAFAVSIWNDSNIFNTRALGLCIMLYLLSSTILIVTQLDGLKKKVGGIAVFISALTTLFFITISFSDKVKFFDTWSRWAMLESVVALILIVCQITSFRKSKNSANFFYMAGIIFLTSFLLDFVAIGLGWWESGSLSKAAFLLVFVMALVAVLRIIPSQINDAAKARELEAEKQALKLELQESRISIMLSQMQPHFIFNTLNTIYHLCDIDPEIARSTINSFSKYLRNNIDNLDRSEMIHFDKEMSFVKAYLDIEKVRFDDELQITFDTAVTNFKLPVLTVQPIVENAVKHGTSKKEGVSSLYISTRETESCYEIEIRDTGVGFDVNNPLNDEQKHIGIINVRQRLKNLCNGTLTVESKVGEGTTAIIRIPKKEETI
jgi:sensor histidine kinase YesM